MRHLLISGGPGHDFFGTSAVLTDVLGSIGATTTVLEDPAAAADELRAARAGDRPVWDLLTVNALRWRMDADRYADQRDRWATTLSEDDMTAIEQHVADGGGLLAVHTAVICFDGHPRWRNLLGATWHWDHSGHPPVDAVEIDPTPAGMEHPVTTGVEPFTVVDELYQRLDIDDDVVALMVGTQGDNTSRVLWVREHGRGRVVTSLLGHGPESMTHPSHRALLARAATWATRTSTTAGGPRS